MILSFTVLLALAAAPDAAAKESALRRAVALLDYVAGDYSRAVSEKGDVLAADELHEQEGFTAEAAKELRAAGGDEGRPLAARADALFAKVQARKSPAVVSAEARALRDEVAQRFGVVLLPSAPPSPERGRALYAVACAACHGEAGQPPASVAQLELAGKLPAFASRDDVKSLTPQRAFSAVTYGVPNTSMPSYEAAYDDAARWDLAFYVLSLSHREPEGGTAAALRLARAAMLPTGYRELAVLTDEQLEQGLAKAGLSERDRLSVLAALRDGPWDGKGGGGGRLGAARKSLAAAMEEAQRGDREGARRAVLALYLDEFETHEPGLRARDAKLVQQIERAFMELRSALEAEAKDPQPAAAQLDALLAQADALESGGSALFAFVAALAIALREGAEAALLIAALLALLRKAGRQAEARAVHFGAGAALLAGGVTWWASGALLSASGLSRELLEGVLQLVTAAVLVYAGHWLLAWAGSRRIIGLFSAKASHGGALMVAAIAFASIYREMFEVVLFFRGLLLESAGAGGAVLAGALAGVAALVAAVAIFQRIGRRLKPRPLIVSCGVLLCGLAVVLVGNGARALQMVGLLPLTVWTGLQAPALGIYGTREGLVAQAVVLAFLIGSALINARRSRKADGAAPHAIDRPAES